jgi:amino acid transporter
MTRRFELGPIIVLAGAVLLLVSLFLDWYGGLTAWDVFELVDLLLAALAVAAIAAALSTIVPDVIPADRRWLPWLVAAAVVIVAVSIINRPPAAAGRGVDTGAWLAFGASLGMLIGAVLSLSRVSFSVAVEGRELRQRVAAVDERQPTTETAAVMGTRRGRGRTEPTRPVEREPGADEA